MKRKKLLSTAVAGALVAAQMVMPVMAADGGEVDVDVTTRTVVIRVEVPTSLAIAVNQFEKGDTGSQIYSDAFDITNKSEIPVKISVTSTATLAATDPITLVPTKAAAEASVAEGGEAWLAIAAKTSAGKYTEEAGKDIKDLTEANENVATFIQGTDTGISTATAEQTFYLAAAAATAPATTPAVTYKKVAPTDADELAAAKKISYAQFYELTALTAQPTDDAGLQKAVENGDVVQIDGSDAVTVLEKGTANVTFASGSTYYSIAETFTPGGSLTTGKVYMYGEAADGEAAGFRYIGKLSERETWTKDDISHINIAYDIQGVTSTKYNEVKDDCTYGLYAGQSAGAASISGAAVDAGGQGYGYTAEFVKGTDLVFTVNFGSQGATAITSAVIGGSLGNMSANASIISTAGNTVTIAGGSWAAAGSGVERFCKITLDDGTEFVIKVTIQ